LRIEPATRRNEVLAFIAGGLADFSISRSRARARGWGIPVPGDPDQVIYVWWDALGNYITGPGYGTDADSYQRWWADADERVHLLGKGVLRFHAVYWPAMLLSAGEPLPTDLFVHDYLTAEGQKISKSVGNVVDPVDLVERFGTDAVRWWLLREVPRSGDTDFTVERLVARYNEDLANGLGNLVNRVVSMIHRYRDGRAPDGSWDVRSPDEALARFDFRRAVAAVWQTVEDANRYVDAHRPWQLPEDERDAVLGDLLAACRALGEELAPFLPDAAAAVTAQCTPVAGILPVPRPLFPRV
jgi:methionyl-tRNA synthetase